MMDVFVAGLLGTICIVFAIVVDCSAMLLLLLLFVFFIWRPTNGRLHSRAAADAAGVSRWDGDLRTIGVVGVQAVAQEELM